MFIFVWVWHWALTLAEKMCFLFEFLITESPVPAINVSNLKVSHQPSHCSKDDQIREWVWVGGVADHKLDQCVYVVIKVNYPVLWPHHIIP